MTQPGERPALTPEQLDFLRGVDGPTVANAIETLKLRDRSTGYIGGSVRCQFPDLGVMVGRALTVSVTDTPGVTGGGDGYWQLFEALDAMPGPAVVVMANTTGAPTRIASAGEIMVTLAQRLGAVGMVTDGGFRDLDEVKALGFHYFMRYTVVSHAWFDLVDVGAPVTIDGQLVATGDLLHGDLNGINVVPDESLDALPGAVAGIRDREAKLLAEIRSPSFDFQTFRGGRGYGN